MHIYYYVNWRNYTVALTEKKKKLCSKQSYDLTGLLPACTIRLYKIKNDYEASAIALSSFLYIWPIHVCALVEPSWTCIAYLGQGTRLSCEPYSHLNRDLFSHSHCSAGHIMPKQDQNLHVAALRDHDRHSWISPTSLSLLCSRLFTKSFNILTMDKKLDI